MPANVRMLANVVRSAGTPTDAIARHNTDPARYRVSNARELPRNVDGASRAPRQPTVWDWLDMD